ncbi:MAG: hypothetical protein VYA55_06125 [Pseudomonadota bacterium]|nr:hypothetical protein [Pseudomonadota bacterium]
MKTITTGLCLAALLGSATVAMADSTIVKVPRENGAVHQEFKNLLNETLSKFRSGIGRVELVGNAGSNTTCNANFYTSGETTFVTMAVADGDFYNEFYIDHPHQSFKKILFQNLIMSDENVELKVVQRDGGYSIVTDGKSLKLSSKSHGVESPTCQFSLAQATLHEGETE